MVDKLPSILVAKGSLLTPGTLTATDSPSDLGIIPVIIITLSGIVAHFAG